MMSEEVDRNESCLKNLDLMVSLLRTIAKSHFGKPVDLSVEGYSPSDFFLDFGPQLYPFHYWACHENLHCQQECYSNFDH